MEDSLVFQVVWHHHIHPNYLETQQRLHAQKAKDVLLNACKMYINEEYISDVSIEGLFDTLTIFSDTLLISSGDNNLASNIGMMDHIH